MTREENNIPPRYTVYYVLWAVVWVVPRKLLEVGRKNVDIRMITLILKNLLSFKFCIEFVSV